MDSQRAVGVPCCDDLAVVAFHCSESVVSNRKPARFEFALRELDRDGRGLGVRIISLDDPEGNRLAASDNPQGLFATLPTAGAQAASRSIECGQPLIQSFVQRIRASMAIGLAT